MTLVWLRRDLRLHDHAALHAATTRGEGPVFVAFLFDTDILAPLPRQDRRVRFILQSLQAIEALLRERGVGLIVRHGRATEELPKLVRELGAKRLVFAHDDDPYALARDHAVRAALPGLSVESVQDVTVFERGELLTGYGQPYTVFTPYKNAWLKALTTQRVAERAPRLERLAPNHWRRACPAWRSSALSAQSLTRSFNETPAPCWRSSSPSAWPPMPGSATSQRFRAPAA